MTVSPNEQPRSRLDSWKEIASHLGRSVRTVQRWEREGLPVHRHDHADGASVFAYADEVDAWWEQEKIVEPRTTADDRAVSAPAHTPRVAVLPFEDLAPHSEPYFADGFAEEVITRLAGARGVHVISRTSVLQLKDRVRYPPARVAKLLSVDLIVEGTILRANGRVVVNVRIVNPSAGGLVVWGKRYEHVEQELAVLQQAMLDDIVTEAAGGDAVAPLPVRAPALLDPRAHDAYLQGLYFLRKRTFDGLHLARARFEQAIAFERADARGYAGLAETWLILGTNEFVSPAESFPLARRAAEMALDRDAENAEALTVLAAVRAAFDWRWSEGEALFDKALAIRPDSGPNLHSCGMVRLMAGATHEGAEYLAKARDIDPLSPIVVLNSMRPAYYLGAFEEALRVCDEALMLAPGFWQALAYRAWVCSALGEAAAAIDSARRAVEASRGHLAAVLALGEAFAVAGREADALNCIERSTQQAAPTDQISRPTPFRVARVLARLGRLDDAFAYLERSRQDRSLGLAAVTLDPAFEPLWADARFELVTASLGLRSVTDPTKRP